MTETFNLSRFIKEAMGYANVRYRAPSGGEYMWFDLESIKNGRNPAWETWKEHNPTLATVETEAMAFDIGYMKTFQNRFGLSPRQIRNFFKVWIGYNPNWGAYINSIGPYRYMGNAGTEEKDAKYREIDSKNRFCFFTKRFQRADAETVMNSYNSYVNEKLAAYKDIMEPGDFDFDLKLATGLKDNGKIDWSTTSLSLDDRRIEQLFENDAFMGAGTQININASGIAKLIREMTSSPDMQNLLQQSINFVAARKNVSPEDVSNLLATGESQLSNARGIMLALMEKVQTFTPVLLRQKAVDEGWTDILDEAVAETTNNAPAGYPNTIEAAWDILTQTDMQEDINPAAERTAEQRAREIIKNKTLAKLTKNISKIVSRKKIENKIRKNNPGKDPPDVVERKTREMERLNNIKMIPTTNDLGEKKSGAQMPTALTVRTSQKSLLNLKLEILQYLSQQDPSQPINMEEVARQMTEARADSGAKAQGKEWTAQDVEIWVERIVDEMNPEAGVERSFSDLLRQTEAEIAEMNDEGIKGSYKDFDTACRMASIYFMTANYEDIDPGTRAVKSIDFRSPPPLFKRDEGAPNTDSQRLSEIRTAHESGEGVVDEEDIQIDDIEPVQPGDIEADIGQTTTSIPPQTTPAQQTEQPVEQPSPAEEPELPDDWTPDEEDINILDGSHIGIPKTMKNTFDSLIKIAEELDLEGNSKDAEEIHLLIRKYLG